MADIQTSIKITDGASGTLKKMNRALNNVTGSFERLNVASNKAFRTNRIAAAKIEAVKFSQEIENAQQNIEQAANSTVKLESNINKAAKTQNSLLSAAKKLAAVYLSIRGIGAALNLSDTLTQTNARLNLEHVFIIV